MGCAFRANSFASFPKPALAISKRAAKKRAKVRIQLLLTNLNVAIGMVVARGCRLAPCLYTLLVFQGGIAMGSLLWVLWHRE
jgi:hypothetical protein